MKKNKYNKGKAPSKQHQPKGFQPKKPQGDPALNPLLIAQAKMLNSVHQQEIEKLKEAFAKQLSVNEVLNRAKSNLLLQFAEDACLMATADVRGLGPSNAENLRVLFREYINEMSTLIADDEDKEAVYGRAKIDQRLAQIEGKDKARPWDERTAWCIVPVEELKNEKSNQSESNPAEVS